jgi:hypothetical protein
MKEKRGSAFDKIGTFRNDFTPCQTRCPNIKSKSNGEKMRELLGVLFYITSSGGLSQFSALLCLSFSNGAEK